MYKIAILGCENSHADAFCDYVLNSGKIKDVEIVGVYSDEESANERLRENFGVYIAKNYDEFVGKIDGLMVTARHGDNHYKYAKPYIQSGIPMFIDKPVTISETDAYELARELKANNVSVTGGSCCVYDSLIQHLKSAIDCGRYGKTYGGFIRSSLNMDEKYGGFFFYAQHLVQVMCEIFGYYPESVKMYEKNEVLTFVASYKDFCVTGEFVDGNPIFYASVSLEKDILGDTYLIDASFFATEFEEFYKLLKGESQRQTYKEFIAPIYILNAMNRSLKSGREEIVNKIDEI